MIADKLRSKSPEPSWPQAWELTLRTWYFACNRNTLLHDFDQIEIAVMSASRNTALRPVCLLDDRDDLADVAARLAWMRAAGVRLIRRRAALFKIVRDHFGAAADPYSGHWLRCDIPVLEFDDDFVLYTDVDVMFRRDVARSPVKPHHLACAPEFDPTAFGYFNSGVMIMNLPALRAARRALKAALREHLPFMAPHDDQRILNAFYHGRWARLPNSWNWKPYWGYAEDAAIVHFHGPKPTMVRRMLAGDVESFGSESLRLFRKDTAAYARYLRETEAFSRPASPAKTPPHM